MTGGAGGGGTAGTGGLPPGAECVDGDRMFFECGPNFDPGGDCDCFEGSWECPAVECPPCPDPVANTCVTKPIYARVPSSSQCCPYDSPCSAPHDWDQYETLKDCALGTQ
jgi:hypothetical protein